MATRLFYPLIPGAKLEGDWHSGKIPANIEVGPNTVIDSSYCFKHYASTAPLGLRIGRDVTIWRTSFAVGPTGLIEIGDECYLANANLAASARLTIGSGVFVAGGATIVDSDFHPILPAARLGDTIALSPQGERRRRPTIEVAPVIIEDEVWIGYNATILKGVRIGAGAVVEPGAVVTRDVPAGTSVAGNPARATSPQTDREKDDSAGPRDPST
jgi:acetyltransferase-like isoleucine patch superfamily enzyme